MRACRPRKSDIINRIMSIRRRRALVNMQFLRRHLIGQALGIMNLDTRRPRINSRRRNRRRRAQFRVRTQSDITMRSVRHHGQNPFRQGPRLQRNNSFWGQADIITTQGALEALNGLAAGNSEPNSLLVMVQYTNGRYYLSLSGNPQNESYIVQNTIGNGQNQQVQDGNDPAAQAADDNNPEVPDDKSKSGGSSECL
ncbi:uncharacterized protein LOC117150476 [Drosophila mauritiana]|uniref:Uncharacterized protein LOC117150476 n=1 Tax=Drosophila mauritiana TaxID=7226 RepID=A0A6P8LFN3_DROMA|nr:uncharacterized protein LOC117150476 [Drosophila mauritiana]